MPKIVDTEKRAEEIARAVFTIICQEGFTALTLARVAEHTGLAIGSIRHYFPTRQLLVQSALDLLVSAISSRIYLHYVNETSPQGTPEHVGHVLEELLPFDASRQQEAILWLRLLNEAVHDATYQPYAAKLSRGMREMIANSLRQHFSSPKEQEIERLSESVGAVIDGITIAMLAPDSRLTIEEARTILYQQIRTITGVNS